MTRTHLTVLRALLTIGLVALATLAVTVTPSAANAATATSSARPSLMPDDGTWQWPLPPVPAVVRAFEPPSSDFGPGHRGVDLATSAGVAATATALGSVSFAGRVAGRGVVVVDHGALRSTYEPVSPTVRVGDHVDAGDQVGLITANGSHCWPDVCLHLGVRRGDTYLDPLSFLGSLPVRLKPLEDLTHGLSKVSRAEQSQVPPEPQPSEEPQDPLAGTWPWATGGALVTLAGLSTARRRASTGRAGHEPASLRPSDGPVDRRRAGAQR